LLIEYKVEKKRKAKNGKLNVESGKRKAKSGKSVYAEASACSKALADELADKWKVESLKFNV
jgi:hypothetical protein